MKKEQYFFVFTICAAFLGALLIVYPFLNYLAFALLITYLLHPLNNILQQRFKNKSLCALILIFLILIVIILPTIFISSKLVSEIRSTVSLVAGSPDREAYVERIETLLKRFTREPVDLNVYRERLMTQVRGFLVHAAPNLLGSLSEIVFGLFIMFFAMFYLLTGSQKNFERLRALIPLAPNLKDKLIEELKNVTWAVIYGQVMTALIQGMLGGLGFFLFGVHNAVSWGFIMVILSFIPLLGTPIIWVPAGIILIMSGATFRGIGLLAWGGLLVSNIDNFIKPRLISGRSNIHPVTVLLGVLGGLKLMGFIGMVAGPLILALFIALVRFYEEEYLGVKKA